MAEEIAFENGTISNFEGLVSCDLDLGSGHTTVMQHQSLEIEPEQFLVLFRPGTTSVRSGLGTFFVLEPEHVNHFLCS